MSPQHMRFGGGPSETVLNPIVALVVLLAVLLICVLKRRLVIAPLLAAGILIPMDQVLVIGSLHFPMIRILILFGLARLIGISGSSKLTLFAGGATAIDTAFILGGIFTAIDGLLLLGMSSFANQVGTLFTTLGMYLLVRFFIRDEKDIDTALISLVYIAVVIAIVMANEQATGRNVFAMLGGFRAAKTGTLLLRDDRYRAMACFSHPILAGTFGATLFPLCLGLWCRNRKHRTTAIIGIAASTVITVTADSSTPLLAYVAVIGAMLLWPIRDKMQIIRRGIVAVLVALHLYMKAPVWSLIGRVDVINGSSGYHRYQLVDQFIRHFGDWCFVGTTHNAEWGWDMWDLANQYVAVGESSGLIPFVLFVATITYGFKFVGRARRLNSTTKAHRWFMWVLGAAMLAHVIAFFGISYFDQTQLLWDVFLAIICTGTVALRASPARRARKIRESFVTEDISAATA